MLGIKTKLALVTITYLVSTVVSSCLPQNAPLKPPIARSDITGKLTTNHSAAYTLPSLFESKSLNELIEDYQTAKALRDLTYVELETKGINFRYSATNEDIKQAYKQTIEYMQKELHNEQRLILSRLIFGQKSTGHNYDERGNSYINVSNHNLMQIQGAMAHEASHAQDIKDETDAQILAWEILASRARDGDLLAKASLFDQLEETLFNYVYKNAYDAYMLDAFYKIINRGMIFGDEKRKIEHIHGDVFENYQRRPLLVEMAAANGMTVYIANPNHIEPKPERPLFVLDGMAYLGEQIKAMNDKRRIAKELFPIATEKYSERRFAEAEAIFRKLVSIFSEYDADLEIFKWFYGNSKFYLADIEARRGNVEEAKQTVDRLKSFRDISSWLPVLNPMIAKPGFLEDEYAFEFNSQYELSDLLEDYHHFKKLRQETEAELLESGINPNQNVTDSETIQERLDLALPYMQKKFSNYSKPKIEFMGDNDFLEQKANKKIINRRLKVIISPTSEGIGIYINPGIQLYDMVEAITYALSYSATGKSESYTEIHTQIMSLELLAQMANNGDMLAKYKLESELEKGALELSYLKSPQDKQKDWENLTGESAEKMKITADNDFARTYEIWPFLYVMRIAKGDTLGGHVFGKVDAHHLARFVGLN